MSYFYCTYDAVTAYDLQRIEDLISCISVCVPVLAHSENGMENFLTILKATHLTDGSTASRGKHRLRDATL